MCGIVGFINKKIEKHVLVEMMDMISHRGPDGSGTYLDEKIAMGHRRLSIIDIEGGVQPMKNEDGNLICIFNGEIYNYRDLRRELFALGHDFTTDSDTEVLIHGYEEWGTALPLKLRGMFAFVIWNRKKQELFCARDYFGIKPFYYYHKDETFLFGSEIKSFLPHPAFEKELNHDQLELYLTYQYSPGNTTFFRNVYKLPPAHYLIWKNGKIDIFRYWQPDFSPDTEKTEEEWIRDIHVTMQQSVQAHKISDVEVGSFLSSGVDSSYVVTLANVDKTFSIGYGEETYNEAALAHEYSKVISVKNEIYQISPEEYWEKLPEIQYYMDEPLADAASAALYFLNREASKQVKVCLSGEGADELFGGYRIYREPFICETYENLPDWIKRVIGTVAERLPQRRGINFLVRHKCTLEQRYIGNTCLFTQKQKRKIMKHFSGNSVPTELSEPLFRQLKGADDVTRMQFTDLHLWLVGDILLKADKMSMANSLELRVPFLDKEVFEVARKIPTSLRVNKEQTKIALRQAAQQTVGTERANREKLGFPVPVREWLKEEPYTSLVWSAFKSPVAEQFFHTKHLTKMLKNHVAGKQDNWRQIWCVYVFLIWYQEYFISR